STTPYSDVIELVRAVPNNADIIYIGESSNITTRNNDNDKRPISGLISDYFPSLKIYDITKPASHAGIFFTLLSRIPKSSNVQTIIVTLNLRSFNAQWIYSDLETPLQKSMVLLKNYPPLLNRFLLSFKAYDIKTKKERTMQIREKWKNDNLTFPYSFPYKNVIEWDKSMAIKGIRDTTGKFNLKQTQLACHYIKGYAFIIDTLNNPRIKDFDKIIKLSKKRGWNLVFNLLAENTQKAKELVGNNLIYLMNKNRKILIDYFENKGISVVDNLNSVNDEEFINRNWTTEHYAEKGRKIIAENVSKKLKEYYPNQYVLKK
ncbi:MAG: DUF4843 domain-containing protein, partial [Chlorobi bacterium]|nr:DUF4843 domain-containing protein [Chlorobiota bacterium]